MPRRLRPRPTVATPAICVSQYTGPALFGFKTERSFLEFVAEHDVRRTVVGRTVFVEVEDLREALRGLALPEAQADKVTADHGAPDDDDQSQTVDEVLARLGVRRTKA